MNSTLGQGESVTGALLGKGENQGQIISKIWRLLSLYLFAGVSVRQSGLDHWLKA